MLYEVITDRPGVQAGKRHGPVRLHEDRMVLVEEGRDECGSLLLQQGVITSYSIHYTKLYDVRLRRRGGDPPRGGRFPGDLIWDPAGDGDRRRAPAAGGGSRTRHGPPRPRITSYNVCYTKLLRTSSRALRCAKFSHAVFPASPEAGHLTSMILIARGSRRA